MSRGAERDYYLLFRSRRWIGALALACVREVMRPLPFASLASAPAFVLGVAMVRGEPTPVIDAALLLSANPNHPTTQDAPTRFISLQVGSRGLCLAVDAVLDVRSLSASDLRATPPLLDEADAELLPRIGALDAQLLAVLNAARMVPADLWETMQTAARTG